MKLTPEEVKLALKISKVIQKRIDITGDTNLRSTDVFPYLVKKGLYPPDKHNGYYFRRFLKKLAKCGELYSLIPQCTRVSPVKDEIYNEWYFHNAKDKMPKPKLVTNSNSDQYQKNLEDIRDATDIIQMLLDGLNPITEEALNEQEIVLDPIVREALRIAIHPISNQEEKELISSKVNISEITSQQANIEKNTEINQTYDEFEDIVEFSEDKLDELKKEVSTWELKYPNKNDYWKNVRKKYRRAYEPWSKKEDEIIKLIWKNIRNEHKIADVLFRSSSSILHRLIHLKLLKESEVNLK